MFSVDSLQVLEKEMVQNAIVSARGDGLFMGVIIGMILMFIIMGTVALYQHREMQFMKRDHNMWKYTRMKMELGWVGMVDICKECIEGDIRTTKPTIVLFNEFPSYDEERKQKEMAYFPNIAKLYQNMVDDRANVVKTLDSMVTRDLEYLNKEMAQIEQAYPVETAEYNKQHEEKMIKKQNGTNNA